MTPDSPAVLPSITNKSLMQLAEDEGMVVEHRPVPFDEVSSFKEVAACGTAVVMTTIKQIVKGGEVKRVGGGRKRRVVLVGRGGIRWRRTRCFNGVQVVTF